MTPRVFGAVVALVTDSQTVRQAVKYLSPSLVVTATRRHRPRRHARTIEVVVTVGAPNVRARAFIADARAAGEPFPIKNIQLRHWSARHGS